MTTWLGLLLAILLLPAGCAPGYFERPASGDTSPGYYETKKWYQNPETEAERDMRMWREESGR